MTGDESVEADGGLELLVETARLWISLGNHGRDGRWHIIGVTGPDEYTTLVADNVFTNLAAAHNLRAAADAAGRHPELAAGLQVHPEETAAWRRAADAAHVPYDADLRVHEQSAHFTRLPEWDFDANRDYPLLLHAPYFDLNRRQVVKQADLTLAMFWFGDHFTAADKALNVDYYERRTVRDSSLSACTQAVLAAEVGHLDLAHDYTYEAASIDLRDLQNNSRDGLHIASLAGAWIALVAGFGGMRDTGSTLFFDPQLPTGITRLRFTVRWQGLRLVVDIEPQQVTYILREGPDATMCLRHAGTEITVTTGRPLTRRLQKRSPLLSRPPQPPGRQPAPRGGPYPPIGWPPDRDGPNSDPAPTPAGASELTIAARVAAAAMGIAVE